MEEGERKANGEDSSPDWDGLLARIDRGEEGAESALFHALYPALKRQAAAAMRSQNAGHTLQPTALVHEVFLRLQRPRTATYKDRDHYLRAASRAMRHILVDHARQKSTLKRGGLREEVPLAELAHEHEEQSFDIQGLHLALEKLALVNPQMAQAAELRFFGGANLEETARVVGLSAPTFRRRWEAAREWLRQSLA